MNTLIQTLATKIDSNGKNVLHTAAFYAAENDDTRFFISLLGLNLPLYSEDNAGNFPAFFIAEVASDSKFSSAFNALLELSFDLNRESSKEETFMFRVCASKRVSQSRI